MTPAEYNFEIYEGDFFSKGLTFFDDNDLPVDLTGYSARMQIRNKVEYNGYKDWSNYLTLGGAAGTIVIEVPATDNTDWQYYNAVYDLELVPPSGETRSYKLLKGNISIIREVTR